MALTSDTDLARAFQQGDDAAFTELYNRYRGGATGYALRMLGSPQEAEEVVTEAFMKVVEGRYDPTGSFKSYLFTLVHRRCLDQLRRRGTRGRALPLLRPVPESPDLDDALDALRDRSRVEAALEQLPAEHRSLVLLYYSQGLSSREVAETTGMTDQQVRSKLSYARKTLRRLLTGSSS